MRLGRNALLLLRIGFFGCLLGGGRGSDAWPQMPAPPPPQIGDVRLLEIDGVINPLTDRYLKREVQLAEAAGSQLLIVRLNTPGGLETSMRAMVQTLLGAKVPIAIHVAPPGARAASAGMFVTIAASIAAMAPGTNIGAAHPVAVGAPPPDESSPRPSDTALEKVINDAAALARSTAAHRGRNAQWAESAVRESVSITAEEALKLKVIDLIASDTPHLLELLDGRKVFTAAGAEILRTRGTTVTSRPMNFAERALHVITEPNIAYLLMTVGFIGIVAEIYSPGLGLPGILGVISLLLAFAGLGSLPVNWAGILLIALSIGLFIAELTTPGLGILAVGGIVAFVIGSLILYTPLRPVSPAMPAVHVNRWLLGIVAILVTAFFLFVIRAIVRTRNLPIATGIQSLVGKEGRALSSMDPAGEVRIGGEVWSAENEEPSRVIHPGDPIVVTGVEGVTLKVKRESLRRAS